MIKSISAPCAAASRSDRVYPLQAADVAEGELHLWRASLEAAGLPAERVSILDDSELERAGRFRSPQDRESYIAAHILQREILASYTGDEPGRLELNRSVSGKPLLRPVPGRVPITFNMSSSRGILLLAVSGGLEIGVDAEFMDEEILDVGNIEGSMSSSESVYVDSLTHGRKIEALFRIWTSKEAFAKGVGEGLAIPFDGMEIEYDAAGTGRVRFLDKPAIEDAVEWNILSLDLGKDHCGALAVKGYYELTDIIELKTS